MADQTVLVVSVADQELRLLRGGEIVRRYPVSTSRFGLGSAEGSFRTPLGSFVISEKIGGGEEEGTVFRSRLASGRWAPGDAGEDLILSRILWLHGLEPENANTKARYIYIHGTHEEERLGTPASHGCVRMANADVIDLFGRVEEGALVRIDPPPGRAGEEVSPGKSLD